MALRCVRLSVRVRDRRPEPPPCSIRAVRRVHAADRVSPRLRPVRRRQRRDQRSWPGSARGSAQPCSPARRRPAGEVRHRPYCEGTSTRRHRTDTAPADRRESRFLRRDDAVWCGSRHGCGHHLHRCNADFTPSLLKRRPEQKARARRSAARLSGRAHRDGPRPATRPQPIEQRGGGGGAEITDASSRGSRRIADGHRRRGGVSDACQITAAFD